MTIQEFKYLRNQLATIIEDSDFFNNTIFFSGECVRNFVHRNDINDIEIGINRRLGGYALAIYLAKKYDCYEKNTNPSFDRKSKKATLNLGDKIPGLKDISITIRETCDVIHAKSAGSPELIFGSVTEDSLRQDFTIEGVFLDFDLKLIRDYTRGDSINDLKEKRIKLTNLNQDIFYNYPDKMLKAIRLACEFDCGIEAKTWLKICLNAHRIDFATNEDIRSELNKIICSPRADEGIRKLYFSGILNNIMPEVCALRSLEQGVQHSYKNVFDHSLEVMVNMKPRVQHRFAGLLHDIGKISTPRNTYYFRDKTEYKNHEDKSDDMIKLVLCFLGYDENITNKVASAAKLHMKFANTTTPSKQTVRRFLSEVKKINADCDLCLDLIHANNMSKDPKYQKPDQVKYIKGIIQKIEDSDRVNNIKLPIKGGDIITRFKIKTGPRVGKAIKLLKDHMAISPKMTKDEAFDILDEAFSKKEF